MAIVPAVTTSRPHPAGRFAPAPWDDHSPAWLELDRQLPPDHLARRIDAAVDGLDLADLFAAYAGTGSLAHPPDLLFKAVLYELHSGRRRPAQWFRDAPESGPLRWLLRGCQPSRSAWYAFRDRVDGLDHLCNAQVLHQATQEGLTPARRASVDGTLLPANASRHRLLNEEVLGRRRTQLEQVCAADQRGEAPTERPAWMAPTPRGRVEQGRRYQRAAERMEQLQSRNAQKRASKRKAREKVLVSTADPEAALGLDKDKVYRPLYNLQVAQDLDSPLVLGYEVLAQANDAGALGPLLARVQELVGVQVAIALGDAGYAGGADLAAAAALGVTVYAPWQANDYSGADATKAKQIPKEQFTWLAEAQTYRCPEGHLLERERQSAQKRSGTETVVLTQYRCAPAHCRVCPRGQQCTPNPEKGRSISRGEHEDLIEALRQRMATEEAKALYRLRRQTVELRYADVKQHRGLRRLSGRGLRRVRTETGLTILVHNLLTLEQLRQGSRKESLAPNLPPEPP
jgi:transposase